MCVARRNGEVGRWGGGEVGIVLCRADLLAHYNVYVVLFSMQQSAKLRVRLALFVDMYSMYSTGQASTVGQ